MTPKIASPNLQWLPHSLSFQKPMPSIVPHFLTKPSRRGQTIVCLSPLSTTMGSNPTRFLECLNKSVLRDHTIRRSCASTSSSHAFDDEESKGELRGKNAVCMKYGTKSNGKHMHSESSFLQSKFELLEPIMLGISPEPPEWPEREAVIRAGIESKANRVGLPLSIQMIKKKKKKQLKEDFRDLGELACCSMEKAFSSLVLIIVELQSCTLQMREVLGYEDLEGVKDKVQREIQESFLWQFHRVLSQAPALMIHVMVLLANFSVFSSARNVDAFSITLPEPKYETTAEAVSIEHQHVVSDETATVDFQEFRSAVEVRLWNSMVDEARKLKAGPTGVVLDHEAMKWLVSPMTVELQPDNYMEYLRTDLLYQMVLSQEPNSSLLLSNYAQFLYLVRRDHDRAEECFKRAIETEPRDAESLSKYAGFLWMVKKDLWGAEERFLQAIAAEPDNPYHASKYASFLWSTGGDETCFPLNTSPSSSSALNT